MQEDAAAIASGAEMPERKAIRNNQLEAWLFSH
jgi:hypothetical protein